VNWRLVLKQRILGEAPRLITVDDFRFVWLKQLSLIRERVEANKLLDIHTSYGPYSRNMPPQSVANPRLKNGRLRKPNLHRSLSVLAVAEEVIWSIPAGLQPHLFTPQRTHRILSQKAAERC
jgi:hypothetical protein